MSSFNERIGFRKVNTMSYVFAYFMYMLNTNVFNNLPIYAYMYLQQIEQFLLCSSMGQKVKSPSTWLNFVDPHI